MAPLDPDSKETEEEKIASLKSWASGKDFIPELSGTYLLILMKLFIFKGSKAILYYN